MRYLREQAAGDEIAAGESLRALLRLDYHRLKSYQPREGAQKPRRATFNDFVGVYTREAKNRSARLVRD